MNTVSQVDLENKLEFYTETSLLDDIEELSNVAIDLRSSEGERLILNIISKYLFHYLVSVSDPVKGVSLKSFSETFNNYLNNHFTRFSVDIYQILSNQQRCFPVAMLADVLRTATLARMIMECPVKQNGESGVVVDAGTGTGILLLFQRIAMQRRKTKSRIDYLGIELQPAVANRSHNLLTRRMGYQDVTVFQGDATEDFWYKDLRLPIIRLINENIANAGDDIDEEPYNKILQAVQASENLAEGFDCVPEPITHRRYKKNQLIAASVGDSQKLLADFGKDFAVAVGNKFLARFLLHRIDWKRW